MCKMAKVNGERVNRARNCNLPYDEDSSALSYGTRQVQCSVLQKYGADLSFIANEGGLPEQMLWDSSWKYVVLVREPRARYLSNYYHQVGALPSPPTLEEFLLYSNDTAFKDNFLTRMLAGTVARLKPDESLLAEKNMTGSGIHQADLLRAMRALRCFDYVFVLESDMDKLDRALGWEEKARAGTHVDSQLFIETLPESTRQILDAKSRYDDLLYAFARELAAFQDRGDWRNKSVPYPGLMRSTSVVNETFFEEECTRNAYECAQSRNAGSTSDSLPPTVRKEFVAAAFFLVVSVSVSVWLYFTYRSKPMSRGHQNLESESELSKSPTCPRRGPDAGMVVKN